MPVDFLSDNQVAAYAGYIGEVEEADLQRYFFLDDEDRRYVERRRRDSNRLGYAVQLCSARAIGRFLLDARDVPANAAVYVAAQLGLDDASSLELYAERSQTHRAHTAEIQRVHGFRDFAEARPEFESWLEARAWNRGDGPKSLFDAAWQRLRDQRILLPGVTTLTRVVAAARARATERLWERLAGLLSREEEARLEQLLKVPAGLCQLGGVGGRLAR